MTHPTGNGPFPLARHPAHLGSGATTIPQPEFTGGMEWYAGYGARLVQYTKEIKQVIPVLRRYYKGLRLTAL